MSSTTPPTKRFNGSTLMFGPTVFGVCSTHGPQTERIWIGLGGQSDGDYCQKCWAEWMAQHVTKLQPVEAK